MTTGATPTGSGHAARSTALPVLALLLIHSQSAKFKLLEATAWLDSFVIVYDTPPP